MATSTNEPKKNWFMRHKILSGIMAFFLIIVVSAALSGPTSSTGSSSSSPTQAQEEIIQISSSELVSAYKENELGADAKYKGKTLEVNGTINTIGESFGKPYIVFQSSDILTSVQCFLKSSEVEKAGSLTQGQPVTVQGRNGGMSLNIALNNCVVK